ncbi:hypothetical protein FRC08_004933 [Ceratobasidium sp. 394]|nr:hypothetical protein FRC08_004933 [Ceratobasidium sp. 394]
MAKSDPAEKSTVVNTEGAQPPEAVNRHPKFFFDNTLIAIKIENTLFNVHKYQLMKSKTFLDMFAIGEESDYEQTTQEGSSPDNPIVMKGVSAADFECLMTVLYASHFSAHQPEPEASLIIPAYRLASMWDFSELCAYLMPLADRTLCDVDKVAFAREFNVNDWLVPAHVRLCLRPGKVTTEESGKLGLDSTLFISRFREEHNIGKDVPQSVTCPGGCDLTTCHTCGTALQKSSYQPPSEADVEAKVKEWVDNGCVLSSN